MFQFKCPAGHLVQAEESHVGQQSSCPTCGTAMVIPGPTPARNDSHKEAANSPDNRELPTIQTGQTDEPASQSATSAIIPALNSTPDVFHIPCPNGHILETPADMIGEYVKCSQCDAEFDLREEESEEFQRRKQMREEAELANLDRKWLNRAIAIVILVAIGAVALVIATVLNR